MIVLDTNVISELAKRKPDDGVMKWLDELHWGDVAITAVTVAELTYGVSKLPQGHRRAELEAAISKVLESFRPFRLLPFDENAAILYGPLVVSCESIGRPIGIADAQIAAITLAGKHTLASRNIRDFEATGVPLMNPWTLSNADS